MAMGRYEKLAVLSEAATGEIGSTGFPHWNGAARSRRWDQEGAPPGGGSTNIMRIMLTNACSLSCGYFPFHAGAKLKRVALAPEEVATTFMEAR